MIGHNSRRCYAKPGYKKTEKPLFPDKFPCHVLCLVKAATYMALSRKRGTTISASLIRRGNLCPVNGRQFPLQMTAEIWLCPVNRRKKSTGAAVLVQLWAAVCTLLLCTVNRTFFFGAIHLHASPSRFWDRDQNFPSKGYFYYLFNVTPFWWTKQQI